MLNRWREKQHGCDLCVRFVRPEGPALHVPVSYRYMVYYYYVTVLHLSGSAKPLSVDKRDASTKTQARGSHGRRTAKQLAQIGKYRENGNTAVARRFERFLLLVTVAVIELPSKEEGAKHGIFGDRCPTLCSPFTTMTA